MPLTPSLHSIFSQVGAQIPYSGAKSGEGLEHGHKYGRKIAKDKSFKGLFKNYIIQAQGRGVSEKMILDYVEGGRGLAKEDG